MPVTSTQGIGRSARADIRRVALRRFRGALKAWKRCACFIFACGNIGGTFSRNTPARLIGTKRRPSRRHGKRQARGRGSTCNIRWTWSAHPPHGPKATTIEVALAAFLAEREEAVRQTPCARTASSWIHSKAFRSGKAMSYSTNGPQWMCANSALRGCCSQ